MYDSTADDGEHESLIPRGKRRKRDDDSSSACGGHRGGILMNRIVVLVLLVLFVVASIYFQSSISSLHKELTHEEETVSKLAQTVSEHADVIRRFNESVTQADVLKQLQALGSKLNMTTTELRQSMSRLQDKVTEQLTDTLKELGDTVKEAQDEISKQVEHVKTDVDQYVITTQDQFSMENSFMVYQLAGTLTLLSCLISMWHMTAHLRKMQEPVVQRKILAILWMPPIYAVTSWFSLVFPAAEGYLAILKDGYEAYVIYMFLSFCIAVLGKGDRGKVVDVLSKRADHLAPPIRLCPCCDGGKDPYENNPHALADAVLLQCQVFAMQFVFLRPLTTIATVVLFKLQYYGAGDNAHDWRSPQFWIIIVQNLSVFTAFAGLLKFYHAVDEDLQWCRPFAKFLCIKGVVFMTFWQGLGITVLAETTDAGGGDPDEWGKSAQNFMICLEMLLFSIAHFYCFPTEEWNPDYRARASRGLAESLALGDFVQDLKLILKSSGKKRKSKKPSEPTVPEGDEETDDDETVRSFSDLSDIESTINRAIEATGSGSADGVTGSGSADEEEIEEEKVAALQKRLELLQALSFSPSPKANQSGGSFFKDASAADAAQEVTTTKDNDENEENEFEPIHSNEATEESGLLERNTNPFEEDEEEDDDVQVPPTKNEECLNPSIFTSFNNLRGNP